MSHSGISYFVNQLLMTAARKALLQTQDSKADGNVCGRPYILISDIK